MKPMTLKRQLLDRLTPFGQQHLLDYWEELNEAQQRALADQIEAIDLELIDTIYRGGVQPADWDELARCAEPPQAIRLQDRQPGQTSPQGITPEQARSRGVEALHAGEIGVLLTAGGEGSRLNFELPKSLYPIGPLSEVTLLELHTQKIRAAASRYGNPLPLYLMTSPATQEQTTAFIDTHQRLGLAEDDLFVFCQGTMPAVDAETGKLLLAAKDQLFLSPDGHGGTPAALGNSGALEHMRSRGIRHLFYLQVDNPLVPLCDPELIGYHLLAQSELTSIAIAKETPQDKLGVFVRTDDQMCVIEYSDLPDAIAACCDATGGLKFWAGSIAVHVFDVALLQRSLETSQALPFHIAQKKVPYVASSGEIVAPKSPNALKFERFIFDLLPEARRPLVVEYASEESFAPLKNAPGAEIDTPEYVREMMFAQHGRWLKAAGAILTEGVQVEISPLFALDQEDVTQKIESGQRFDQSQYLSGEVEG